MILDNVVVVLAVVVFAAVFDDVVLAAAAAARIPQNLETKGERKNSYRKLSRPGGN